MTAYVVRTETDGQALFHKLQSGSARIGWSYRDDLNLQNIVDTNNRGEWSSLDGDQKDAWYCHGFVDATKIGDLLFYPHIPAYGLFCIVRVLGEYQLVPSDDGIDGDFRSSRACELLTPYPIDKFDAIVSAAIQHKLGLQRRFYQMNVDVADIDFLLGNLSRLKTGVVTHSLSFSRMMHAACGELSKRWTTFFPVANLSRFLAELLERHGEHVDLREGPSEAGTDLVVEIQNDFLDRPIVIGVQVGSYEGAVYPDKVKEKLDQLLSGWVSNALDYGALVLTGEWTEEAKLVLENHNRENPSRRVKGIDGLQLARIVTRTTWLKDT